MYYLQKLLCLCARPSRLLVSSVYFIQVFDAILDKSAGITVYTAVPTIYAKLLEYWRQGKVNRSDEEIKEAFGTLRYCSSLTVTVW